MRFCYRDKDICYIKINWLLKLLTAVLYVKQPKVYVYTQSKIEFFKQLRALTLSPSNAYFCYVIQSKFFFFKLLRWNIALTFYSNHARFYQHRSKLTLYFSENRRSPGTRFRRTTSCGTSARRTCTWAAFERWPSPSPRPFSGRSFARSRKWCPCTRSWSSTASSSWRTRSSAFLWGTQPPKCTL